MNKLNEEVGVSDKAGVVIRGRDKKIVKEIKSENKNDKSDRKVQSRD